MVVKNVDNKEHLEQLLAEAGNKLVVIDFFATWCGPCKIISPKVDQLSEEITDVVFLKVDVDACETVAETYNVSSMPTFVFIRETKEKERFSGANAEKLKQLIVQHSKN